MNIHVLPINDLREHKDIDIDCWCEPIVIKEKNGLVITHNSADHREYFERDRKKAIN